MRTVRNSAFVASVMAAIVVSAMATVATADDVACAFTADTEGRIWPGGCCGDKNEIGCLPRRATVLAAMRKGAKDLLVLEAGNFLFGPDSLDSKGQAMVVAYNALGYDVANISYRDFRLGKSQTLETLKEAKFVPVSANLLDAQSGRLLFKPYVVKEAAGKKTAILGLTELVPGVARLPHMARQLEGVTARPPADALTEWLPKAKAESGQVIVLYYGSLEGLKTIRDKAGADVAAIFVGGVRPDELPTAGKPPVAAAHEFGRQIAKVLLGSAKIDVTQEPVNANVAIDEPTKKLLLPYAREP